MKKYTPATVVDEDKHFSIPIYQRLYEWSAENVETLLNDLIHAFTSDREGDYYIGLLTSTTDNELVDGQQRFTVMMLLGSVLQNYDDEWKAFLSPDSRRLTFSSRPDDQQYLQAIISGIVSDEHYVNLKMKECVDSISSFIDKYMERKGDIVAFSNFVYHHLTFL